MITVPVPAVRAVASVVNLRDSERRLSEMRVRHECGEVITLLCVCHDLRRCHRSLLAELILGHPPVGRRAGCL